MKQLGLSAHDLLVDTNYRLSIALIQNSINRSLKHRRPERSGFSVVNDTTGDDFVISLKYQMVSKKDKNDKNTCMLIEHGLDSRSWFSHVLRFGAVDSGYQRRVILLRCSKL